MIILLAKMQCAAVHAVIREGLYFSIPVTIPAMLFGGRGVKPGAFSSSGLRTKNGSKTDMTKVMMENAISAVEPTRPTLPVKS